MASLAEIRAKLQAQETRSNSNGGGRDNAIYPHWDIPEGTTTRIRFLPDGNPKNDFFWVERAMIRLPFSGVKGVMNSKPVVVQVPCMEMYGETCPVLTEVRPWYKDNSLKDMANKYWKKRSYLFQGLVRDNPIKEDNAPENPIRRFAISPQIYPLVIAALKDPEIEELPTDFERGLDFSITKTSKGQYADYSTSKWARKESALTASERAAVEAYGLFNLAEFLPKKPGEAELAAIKEMFEASVNGETYDESRWGSYYKPYGNSNSDAGSDDAPVARSSTPKSVGTQVTDSVTAHNPPWQNDDEDDAPVAKSPVSVAPKGDSNQRAAEILSMIRNRKSAE